MNLVLFIENRYQELTQELQKTPDAFDVVKDSEIKAAHDILTAYRWFLKWAMMPKVIFQFILVKLHLRAEPVPVLLNKLRADKELKAARALAAVTDAQMKAVLENQVMSITPNDEPAKNPA